MNLLFSQQEKERNYLSGGMSVCVSACVCVRALISFNTLPYRIDKVLCDQCYWWAPLDTRNIDPCTQLHTQTYGLTHTPTCSYSAGFACSTTLAYSQEALVPVGMFTDLKWYIWSSGCLHLLIHSIFCGAATPLAPPTGCQPHIN